eukprot:COSAG01_NODE_14447_length_1452_cov_12.848485_1_plen_65_part_10
MSYASGVIPRTIVVSTLKMTTPPQRPKTGSKQPHVAAVAPLASTSETPPISKKSVWMDPFHLPLL